MLTVSFIIPAFNEVATIEKTLLPLQQWRHLRHEIIVADGGSTDNTMALARPLADNVIRCPKGRAAQMNSGAALATGDVLVFLHADTLLPVDALSLISNACHEGDWGRFDVRLSGHKIMLRVIETMMNLRSRLSGIATGDQAIFIRREVFEALSGFCAIPLMEDIELSTRLKQRSRPVCLKQKVTTSSRRWEQNGIWRTIFLMWRLRLSYFFGTSPEQLIKRYQ